MTSTSRDRHGPSSWFGLLAIVLTLTLTLGLDDISSSDDEERDRSECYVVTIFGLKTAECGKQSSRSIPNSLDVDLQVMRFDENKLTVLSDASFSSYANLQEIYLARNQIEQVAPTALRGLYSLQILDLESNKLGGVPSIALRLVGDSLRLLNLKNNPIRQLYADSFLGLVRLEEINLENCWLKHIDPAAFQGLTRLVEINLVNNELRTFDVDSEPTLSATSLRVLRLYRNPWSCNCRLRWLRRWVSTGPSPTSTIAASEHRAATAVNWDFASNTPTCAAPPLLRGVAWKHLTPDQFACPTRIVGLSGGGPLPVSASTGNRSSSWPSWSASASVASGAAAEIKVVVGRNATIECVAAGDPEPSITWSRDPDVPLGPGLAVTVRHRGLGAGDDVIGEPVVVGVLTLVAVDVDRDTGDYRCTADNPAGRAEVSFRLTVIDAGSSLSSGRPLESASNERGSRRTVEYRDEENRDAWSDAERDTILGIIGGILVFFGIIALFIAFRPKIRNFLTRHRNRHILERRNHDEKITCKLNGKSSSVRNGTAQVGIGMTSLAPAMTQRTHYAKASEDYAVDCSNDSKLSEPEDDDDQDTVSCEEPLARSSVVFHELTTGNGGTATSNRKSYDHRTDSSNDIENEDDEENNETSSNGSSRSDYQVKPNHGKYSNDDDDEEDISETDRSKGAASAADSCCNRSVRTVSFGPDLVLDSSVDRWPTKNNHETDSILKPVMTSSPPVSVLKPIKPEAVDKETGRSRCNIARETSPVSLNHLTVPSSVRPCAINAPIHRSSSHDLRVSGSGLHKSVPIEANGHVTTIGEVRLVPVGRPCVMWPKTMDARCRIASSSDASPPSNRRNSGAEASAISGQPLQPFNNHRPYSGTFGNSPSEILLPASFLSLDRPYTKRRLPQLGKFTIDDQIQRQNHHLYPSTGAVAAAAASQKMTSGGNNRPMAAGGQCSVTTPYTLAEILAPPFGGFAAGIRVSERRYSNFDLDDDDESTTTIL